MGQYWPAYAGATSAMPSGLLQSQRIYDELNRPLTLQTLSEGGGAVNTSYSWVSFTKIIVNAKSQAMRETRDVWGCLRKCVISYVVLAPGLVVR